LTGERNGSPVEGAMGSQCGSRRAFSFFPEPEVAAMLRWALGFLVLALIAAFFGFGGIAVASAGIAKILFFLFLIVFVITLLTGVFTARRVT
jgi:uncharacterized membrane protein YtjA (UPF0391 family)